MRADILRTRLIAAGLIVTAGLLPAACGKVGRPIPPAGTTYPQAYPQELAPTAARQKDGRALVPEWDADDLARADKDRGQKVVDPSVRQQYIRQSEDMGQRTNRLKDPGQLPDPAETAPTPAGSVPPASKDIR